MNKISNLIIECGIDFLKGVRNFIMYILGLGTTLAVLFLVVFLFVFPFRLIFTGHWFWGLILMFLVYGNAFRGKSR